MRPHLREKNFNQRLEQYCQWTGTLAGIAIPLARSLPMQGALMTASLNQVIKSSVWTLTVPGENSIQFRHKTNGPTSYTAQALLQNALSISANTLNRLNRNSLGDAISNAVVWRSNTTHLLGFYDTCVGASLGNFVGQTDKYIGIRFNDGGMKYGWVQLTIPGDVSQMTVVVWGYEGSAANTTAGIPLPIEWLDIEVKVQKKALEIVWLTASEENAERFEVERSEDGLALIKVGQVGAAGNSQAICTKNPIAFSSDL